MNLFLMPDEGYSSLDVSEMERLGLSNPPMVEQSVAHHPHANRWTTLICQSLPSLENVTLHHFHVPENIYIISVGGAALNVTSLLMAFQAELLE